MIKYLFFVLSQRLRVFPKPTGLETNHGTWLPLAQGNFA